MTGVGVSVGNVLDRYQRSKPFDECVLVSNNLDILDNVSAKLQIVVASINSRIVDNDRERTFAGNRQAAICPGEVRVAAHSIDTGQSTGFAVEVLQRII